MNASASQCLNVWGGAERVGWGAARIRTWFHDALTLSKAAPLRMLVVETSAVFESERLPGERMTRRNGGKAKVSDFLSHEDAAGHAASDGV